MKLWTGEVHRTLKRLRFRAGVDPKTVKFETGYGAMAIESFGIFDRLQKSGIIPAEIKFQVAIPSPFAPTYNYISKKWRAAFLDVFTAHLCNEVAQIAKALPNDRIAIQWDVLQEILAWENYFTDRDDDYMAQIRTTLGRIGNAVPKGMELGYHLCYGSPKEEHLVQPKDAETMVGIIDVIFKAVNRPVEFFHLPVPKPRTDADFYKPLTKLSLPADSELYLGLVHLNDDEGNRARLKTAQQFAKVTGVSTECGWGRGNPERVRALLETHRTLVA
jgi:methionine synthase II (cobalamin-independent)